MQVDARRFPLPRHGSLGNVPHRNNFGKVESAEEFQATIRASGSSALASSSSTSIRARSLPSTAFSPFLELLERCAETRASHHPVLVWWNVASERYRDFRSRAIAALVAVPVRSPRTPQA